MKGGDLFKKLNLLYRKGVSDNILIFKQKNLMPFCMSLFNRDGSIVKK